MEVNFLNQNPCIPSCPGVFQFDIFFRVFWVFFLEFYRVLLVLLSYCLYIQSFRYTFSVAIFSSKIVRFLWGLVVGTFLLMEFSFVVFECPVLSILYYPLSTSLLSPELSGLFPQEVLLFFLVLSFAFCSHIFQVLFVLPFWTVFVDIFICVSSLIFLLVLTVSSGFLRGAPIFLHTNFALHRLIHLTLLYYSLICKVVFDLFCLFLFQVFSILCFLMMRGWSSHCS